MARNVFRIRKRHLKNLKPYCLVSLVVFILMILQQYKHAVIKSPFNFFSSAKSSEKIEDAYPGAVNKFRHLQLKIDNNERSREDIVRDTQRALPHLPILIWEQETEYRNWYYKNASCARFPDVYDLEIYDHYWQSVSTERANFHLFGAYYDTRELCSICPVVRILGMIDSEKPPTKKLHCQLWFANRSEPVIVETIEYINILSRYWAEDYEKLLYAYFIMCPIPQEFSQEPIFVSLVKEKCDRATNILTVNYNKPTKDGKKDRFAVCLNTVDYHHKDMSARLIEWIELVRLLGAKKIFLYVLHVHENMTKTLEYYKQQGLVEVVPITLGGKEPNTVNFQHLYLCKGDRSWHQRCQHELISINDFFYKNMYRYDYLSSFDLDEMIVPVEEDSWDDLVRRLEKNFGKRCFYTFMNVPFFNNCDNETEPYQDIPAYMYMLQHTLRTKKRSPGHSHKVFLNTERVEVVTQHWACRCLPNQTCTYYVAKIDREAKMHHYRHFVTTESCQKLKPQSVNDTSIWKHKQALIHRTSRVLYDLEFIAENN